MTDDARPILVFNAPSVKERGKRKSRPLPKIVGPGSKRQEERLSPQFKELVEAFKEERVKVNEGTPTEVDPSLVIVLDLAGSVQDFHKAVDKVEGLEFLAEMVGDEADPSDDFYITEHRKGRTEKKVPHSLCLAMSNAKAVDQLLSLFNRWQRNPKVRFNKGLGKFKNVFAQLVGLRRWGPKDRVRETGLLERWRETLDVVGQSYSPVRIEVELWYRNSQDRRRASEQTIRQVMTESGGKVMSQSQIEEIRYHALLVELPRQQVKKVLKLGRPCRSLRAPRGSAGTRAAGRRRACR